MKCLKCGFVTSETKEQCARCGSPLPAHLAAPRNSAHRIVTPAPPPPQQEPSPEVPDWRKEVTRKVKEYGEKKKILTTPPQPLRDNRKVDIQPEPALFAEPDPPRPKITTSVLSRVEPPEPDPPPPPPAPAGPLPEPRMIRQLPPLDEEIFAGDLELDTFEEEDEMPGDEGTRLYLGRRAGSLLIDSAIIVVLHAVLLYLCAEIISRSFHDLLLETWLPLAGIFLLFHCLYYSYFYKTSRQTPGQVFFGVEIRDPMAGGISLQRILVRWFCFVFLNVFNFIPLLLGRHFLLLDRISGTRIQSLKHFEN